MKSITKLAKMPPKKYFGEFIFLVSVNYTHLCNIVYKVHLIAIN